MTAHIRIYRDGKRVDWLTTMECAARLGFRGQAKNRKISVYRWLVRHPAVATRRRAPRGRIQISAADVEAALEA